MPSYARSCHLDRRGPAVIRILRTLALVMLLICPALASSPAARAASPPTGLPTIGLPGSPSPSPSSSPAVTFASADGLTVQTQKALDTRLYALTMTTKALPAIVNVRILL